MTKVAGKKDVLFSSLKADLIIHPSVKFSCNLFEKGGQKVVVQIQIYYRNGKTSQVNNLLLLLLVTISLMSYMSQVLALGYLYWPSYGCWPYLFVWPSLELRELWLMLVCKLDVLPRNFIETFVRKTHPCNIFNGIPLQVQELSCSQQH